VLGLRPKARSTQSAASTSVPPGCAVWTCRVLAAAGSALASARSMRVTLQSVTIRMPMATISCARCVRTSSSKPRQNLPVRAAPR